ncbi:hypothetical protein [Macrococcoides caseolyticum]|uniref:hypothetical protein n=1 Tax=Macrococcoides caseolyticum TaxID=69966 RepID=UPI001F1912F8|nr:hypothetical protein [Macrococcus caseolyticus]MCE4957269.1 hypothetical protein [Macrococcus caseolyticus]
MIDEQLLRDKFNVAKSEQLVRVFVDGQKYYCESADELIEQVKRKKEYDKRLSKMKTLKDYMS